MSLEILVNYLNNKNIDITDFQLSQFEKFASLLSEKNKVMNLTAVKEGRDTEIRHFVDSLSLLGEYSDFCNTFSCLHDADIIDIGTGAGFPGIPLAIMLPDCRFTLVDSLQKRISFLDDVVAELSLTNINLICSRFEEAGRSDDLREHFDIGVSRAVADLRVLLEFSLPFIKTDGFFVAYKSGDSVDEISCAENALHELHSSVQKIVLYHEIESELLRSLVVVKKDGIVPDRYPRRNGIPSKRPL